MRKLLLIFLYLSAGMLSGCAFGTRQVFLENSGSGETPKNQKTDSLKRLYFTGFLDKRVDMNIGHVQNSYGSHTAEVVAENDPVKWVNREVVTRLRNKGFSFLPTDTAVDARELSLSGDVLKVYTTAYLSYQGEVSFMARLSYHDRVVIDKKYTGYCSGDVNMAGSARMFGTTLENALRDAAMSLAKDIDSVYTVCRSETLSPTVDSSVTPNASPDSSASLAAADSLKQPMVKTLLSPQSSERCPLGTTVIIVRGNRLLTAIADSLRRVRQEVYSFYAGRVELNQDLAGKLCVKITIGTNGTVEQVTIIMNTLNDPPVEHELVKKVQSITFLKRSKDTEPTEALFSMNFDPGSAKAGKNAYIACSLIASLALLLFNVLVMPGIRGY